MCVINMGWVWGWSAVEAIATCFLVVGIVVAIWQLWETRKRVRIEFTERRLEGLNTPDAKEALQIAYEKTPSKLSDLAEKDRVKLVQLLEHMQALGLLVERGYADKKLAIEAHRGKFIRCWYKLKPCICYERHEGGKYGEGIEYLAKEAYKYQQKKFPRDKWVKLNNKVCEIDINESC